MFTPTQARAAGVTARRLRARDLEHPYRGLMVVRPERPVEEERSEADATPFARDRAQRKALLRRAREYQPLMVSHAFFVGRTAGVLHGLPLDPPGELEVGVCAPHRAPRRRGIRGRKIAPGLVSVCEVDGLRVASPVSTWAMLASELSVRELVVIGDAIVHVPRDSWGRPQSTAALGTMAQLHTAIDAGRRPGLHRLREAITSIRVGSASPLETEYRLDAETAGLPEPELDVQIRDASGRLLGITEIVYRDFRVLVEIEGDHHRTSKAQWNRDIEKYAAYIADGWELVRLTSSHIRGANRRATEMVRAALMRHGWRP